MCTVLDVAFEPEDATDPKRLATFLKRVSVHPRKQVVVDLYRALYMQSFVGTIHEGVVSGLVGSGVFVSLEHPYVDVLVRLEALGSDSYGLDETGLYVIGARNGERITFGDTMLVQIEEASILRRLVIAKRVVREGEGEEGAGDSGARFGSDKPKRRTKKTKSTVPEKPSRKSKDGKKVTTKTKKVVKVKKTKTKKPR